MLTRKPVPEGKFLWDACTIRVYLQDTGEDLPDNITDSISDIVNDYLNATADGLRDKLIQQYPNLFPEVEIHV